MQTLRTRKKRPVRWLSTLLLFGAILTLTFPALVCADGTGADQAISNRASIAYQVGGQDQVAVQSDDPNAAGIQATIFQVDRKIDLVVQRVGGASIPTQANTTAQVMVFTVTNTGNATQDFDLSAVNFGTDHFGGTENEDVTIVGWFVENDAAELLGTWVPGNHGYDSLTDTATAINDLAPDFQTNVYVVCNIPGDADQDDIAAVLLRATALETDGSALTNDDEGTAWDQYNMQTLFVDDDADPAPADTFDDPENAQDIDSHSFIIAAASLTVTKVSVVISDGLSSADPKAIPGAIVEYTITVTNAAGSSTATNVVVTDDLSGPTSPVVLGYLAFVSDAYSSTNEITVEAPDISGGVLTELTEAAADDEGEFVANVLTVRCGDLDAGESAIVKFRVEVQ